MKPKPTILFMGTPDFAVSSLQILVENNYPVVGVVTQPDKPRGRGKKLVPAPVKVYALSRNIPIYQPARVRDDEFLRTFRELAPDMVVLAAFGQILPEEIISFPKYGCINVHPSLLPKYRGAAPINWALIRGERTTGVTIIFMDVEVDAGNMLLQQEVMIAPDETFGELHDRLARLGAELLLKAVEGVTTEMLQSVAQDSTCATFAPRLTKDMAHVDWSSPVAEIINLIRGLSPLPGAYAYLSGRKLKILKASGVLSAFQANPGTLTVIRGDALQVAAKDGYVLLQEVQLEGKRSMPTGDFLRGYRLGPDEKLE